MIEQKRLDENTPERAYLVGLAADNMSAEERATEESLDELAALLETAGGITCGRMLQHRRTPDPRSFIGAGKVEELKRWLEAECCTLAVFDNELSPSQTRALANDLGVRVVDRSTLILDIFAQRAQTREGRLQVELAQYKYLLPRLTGMWTHLDRETASGGSSPIGTRGTGETQLEDDRRYIRRRIERLEQEMQQVRKIRATQRRLRKKNGVPVAALVGYTNAGKSTLLNALTGADIPANNRLFDTLDTTTRKMILSPNREVLLSDTVGFIRKLPHHLVEAFKATLEELSFADLIIHVIDASNPEWEAQAQVVDGLIAELCDPATPRLEVFNKADLCRQDLLPQRQGAMMVSAYTGAGLEDLLQRIGEMLDNGRRQAVFLLPYGEAGFLNLLHRDGEVLREEYGEGGVELEAVVPPELWGKVKRFVISAESAKDE